MGKTKPNYEMSNVKYVGVDPMLPCEENAVIFIFEDRIQVELFNKSKTIFVISYKDMTDIKAIDAGSSIDGNRVILTGVIGLLWKKHHVYTVIEYGDKGEAKTLIMDFMDNTRNVHPYIYERFRRAKQDHPSQVSIQRVEPKQGGPFQTLN